MQLLFHIYHLCIFFFLFFFTVLCRKGTRIEETMRVQVHTKFCFLCVLTFLFHQGNHCHKQDSSHHHGGNDNFHSDLQMSQASYVSGGPLAPESSRPQGHSLEEEQHFYIQQLFNRYGQKGRLDFHGFQSLLFSLGLGEVKVVGVKHDELGHDHVSHLDLVDAQEGLHMHSPAKDGHSGHGHSHGHFHHDQGSHDPHSDPDAKGCNQQTTADTPVAERPTGHELNHGHNHNHDHDHDHDHHHHLHHDHNHDHDHHHDHDHDHNHDHHLDHDHDTEHKHNHTKVEDFGLKQDNGHFKETFKKKHEPEQTQVQPNSKNLTVHNDVHRVQTGTVVPNTSQDQQPSLQVDPSSVQPEQPSSTSTTVSQPKRPQKPGQIRGQRRRNRTTPPPPTSEDYGDHHDDTHKNARKDKREVSGGPGAPSLPAAVLPLHQGGLAHQHEEVGQV